MGCDPFTSRSDCTFARDGHTAVCVELISRTDVWLIENFGELVAAAR